MTLENLTRPIVGIENRTAQEAFDIMADRFRAHLSTAPSGQAPLEGVKALEWQLLVDGGNQGRTEYFEAQTILGYYTAYERYGNVWFETPTRNDFNATRASTIEAAKAAAQADYEARIRSSLLPAGAEPVATKSCGCVFRDLDVACRNPECKICHDLPASGAVEAGWQLVPVAALKWLNGEGPDHNGDWFGDVSGRGNFWWRKHFSDMLAAAPTEGR